MARFLTQHHEKTQSNSQSCQQTQGPCLKTDAAAQGRSIKYACVKFQSLCTDVTCCDRYITGNKITNFSSTSTLKCKTPAVMLRIQHWKCLTLAYPCILVEKRAKPALTIFNWWCFHGNKWVSSTTKRRMEVWSWQVAVTVEITRMGGVFKAGLSFHSWFIQVKLT